MIDLFKIKTLLFKLKKNLFKNCQKLSFQDVKIQQQEKIYHKI